MHTYKSKPHSNLSPVLKKMRGFFVCFFFQTSWSSSSASLISHVNQSLLQPVTPARRLIDSSPPQSDVKMASIMEGPLSKWTNVMKGWQYRWFVLDYNAGLLSYYTVGSSHRFVFVDPLRRWTVEVGWLSPKGLLFVRSWESELAHTGEPLYRQILTLTNNYAHRRPTGQSNGNIISTLPLLWLVS